MTVKVSAQEREVLEDRFREYAEELRALDAHIDRLCADKQALIDVADRLAARCERAEQTLAWMQHSTKVRFGQALSEVLSHPSRIIKLLMALAGMYRDWRRYRTEGPPLVSMHEDLKALLEQLDVLREALPSELEGEDTISPWVALRLGTTVSMTRKVLLNTAWPADQGLPLSAVGGQSLEMVPEHDEQEYLLQYNVADAGRQLGLDVDFLGCMQGQEREVLAQVCGVSVRRRDEEALFVRLRFPGGTERIRVCIHASRSGRVGNACQIQVLRDGVSVVIPTYQGAHTLVETLESIAEQDLEREKFDVIVVQNGPMDGTLEKVEAFRTHHPDLNLELVCLDGVGAGKARNAGAALAQRRYLAFVDDDDWITPTYLSSLLRQVAPDAIAISQIVDVVNGQERDSHINHQVRQAAELDEPAAQHLHKVLCMTAAKLLPTALARQVLFDETLRSGEDVQYLSTLLARFHVSLRVAPLECNAMYRRRVRPHSLSRQPDSFDFCVQQRLQVVAQLEKELHACNATGMRRYLESVMRSQINFAVNYLSRHPGDYGRFNAAIVRQGLEEAECVRWANTRLADTVVFSYCFAPYIDTAGVVAAKRIREDCVPVDIISNRMDTVRKKDPRLIRLVSDLAGERRVLDAPTAFANWNAMQVFAARAVEAAEQLASLRGRPYARAYSRAMWPGSHFAGAAYKARYPQVRWVAEFSDPLWMDIHGQPREEPMEDSWLKNLDVRPWLRKHGINMPRGQGIFFWCEMLPYLMADELVFTNANQLDYMMSYLACKGLEGSIRQRAVIKPHPVLPRRYYALSDARIELGNSCFNMAYFGSFYANRGLHDVLAAMAALKQARGGSLPVCLHVYTAQGDMLKNDAAFKAVCEHVRVHDLVGYLEFLALSKQFDCLIVTDTETKGVKPVNPYLPSKISDYLGSDTSVWAIVEDGSPMHALATTHEGVRCMGLGEVGRLQNELESGMAEKLGGVA